MIFNILQEEMYDGWTKAFLIIALPIIIFISLTIHEYAHAIVSYSMGDVTAKQRGRLTMNPFAHLNPIGTLCMLLFGFGWANPVPINARYYKNPKRGMAICGIAGPAINMIIGIKAFICYNIAVWVGMHPNILNSLPLIGIIPESIFETMYVVIAQVFFLVGYYNILLAIFNLLPIPPLDGSRLLYAFLPDKHYFGIMKYERIIMLGMLVLLWIGVFDFFIANVATIIAEGIEAIVFSILNAVFGISA